MSSTSGAVLALDIGGTKLAAGVVTPDGAVHQLRRTPTLKHEGPDAVIDRLFALGQTVLDWAGLGSVSAIGISCGGPLDAETGVVMSPLNLPDWVNIPLTARAAATFGVPAYLVNDATAGMVAEHRIGAAIGTDIALYLTISTGVGGGAFVNGRILSGAAGNGGEFGHVMVRPGGRRCTCGRNGCIEAYASGTSIAARAREALGLAQEPSVLADLAILRSEEVVAAAIAGDPLALSLWNETTDVLGQALTDLVNTFEPEVIVLGGGVTHAGSLLLDPVRDIVAKNAIAPAAAAVRIELAHLGDAVCVAGAGLHALSMMEALSNA